MNRKWTKSEIEYLENEWGSQSVPAIAKALDRTEIAVTNKAWKLGLGRFTMSGDYITLYELFAALGYKAYTGTLPTNFNVSTIFKDVKIRPNVIAKIKDPQLLNYVKEELTEILRDPHLTPSGRKEYRKFIGKTAAGTFLHERGFNDTQIDYLVNLIDTSKIWNSLVKTDMDSNQMSNYAKKFNEKVDERVRNGENDLIDEVIVLLNNEADISEFDNWMNKVAKQTGVNTGIGEPDN